ncbi:MAG TPA: hypothetical protein VN727_06395 [Candidatus Binatia bacterium]|nr:hypothetical protein [Candidatus Binatia bacterium]
MENRKPKYWLTQREKSERAFQAYLDLLDAADYMKARVYDQLADHGLTIRGVRVLELLHRQGPALLMVIAQKCQWKRQNLDVIVKGLADDGWVEAKRLKVEELETLGVEIPEGDGRPLSLLSLTEQGAAFAARFLPRHAKVIKAYMRALEGREQRTLSQLCRKLREGDAVKFISEMEHEDAEE